MKQHFCAMSERLQRSIARAAAFLAGLSPVNAIDFWMTPSVPLTAICTNGTTYVWRLQEKPT